MGKKFDKNHIKSLMNQYRMDSLDSIKQERKKYPDMTREEIVDFLAESIWSYFMKDFDRIIISVVDDYLKVEPIKEEE